MVGILIVDDQRVLRKNLSFYLKSQGFDVDSAESGEEALDRIKEKHFDIVISDYKLEKMNGHQLMKEARALKPSLEFIMITGYGNVPMAVEVLRDGAADFITKPFEYSAISESIKRIKSKNQTSPQPMNFEQDKIVASSPKMKEVLAIVKKAAASELSVLIEGETGTGKEFLAKTIHDESVRSRGEFVVVECSPNHPKLEVEIFGRDGQDGALCRAAGGTVLIRDVDGLPLSLQARLLRFMREGTFIPADSSSVKSCDVRVIATTTKSLKQIVRLGLFKEDLYYLLNIMPIFVPPLRERREDIMPLVEYFLARHRNSDGKGKRTAMPDAISWMISYEWPGNVKELENTIARACALATSNIVDESLFFTMPDDRPHSEEAHANINITLKDNQRTLILKTLKQNNSNFSQTATQLGISRTTLWRRLKKFKLDGIAVEKE